MTNEAYEIDEFTFKKLPVENQNWILYNTFNKYRTDMETRVCAIEKRKLIYKVIAGAAGFIGGFIAVLTNALFNK
jgi:hypothetical protein